MPAIPEALHAALAQADEEYLVGLCNRGTVNRGKKDLAGLTPAVQEAGDAVAVTLGEVTCTIRAPLGESGCTCPAPGMCRHRIAAILWLQSRLEVADAPREEAPDLSALLEVPVDRLRRAIGGKGFYQLVFRLGREGLPPIAEGSTVRVELPWQGESVKLLLPLEHATCTCHSRELCRHKAAALLCYQLQKGKHTLEELAGQAGTEDSPFDPEQVSAAARAVRELTAQVLDIGLSRLPPQAGDSARRLAALCHTAALPRLESGLRILGTQLERAQDRSAAFRTEELLLRLAEVHHLARQLEGEQDRERLRELAGSFREEYRPCPPLELALLGERQFAADSGYAGTVYYFWAIQENRWYTYTVARPTIYDDAPRPGRRSYARNTAPWGLDGLMDGLYGLTLRLERGRAAAGGRLSSSEESRAVVTGSAQPWQVLPREVCWEDFAQMFRAVEPYLLEGTENQRLVLLRPARCLPRAFDRTDQRFRLDLADREGRTLPLEVRYRASEQALVRTLEGIVRGLEERPEEVPAFLCLIRLEGEGLTLYPVEVYDHWGCVP